jgi:hypothetical protein
MITAYDVQFQTYYTKIGPFEATIWDDGDIVVDVPSGVPDILINIEDMVAFVQIAGEFIEERKKVKTQ